MIRRVYLRVCMTGMYLRVCMTGMYLRVGRVYIPQGGVYPGITVVYMLLYYPRYPPYLPTMVGYLHTLGIPPWCTLLLASWPSTLLVHRCASDEALGSRKEVSPG